MTEITLMQDAIGATHGAFSTTAAPRLARIACLVPSITETLFALGLGDQVVARTGFCIHPANAVREVPKVGGTKDVNIAKLIATEPTHVIVNIDENRKADVDIIRKTIPNVIVTHPLVPEDNFGLYQLLGHIFGVPETADRLCNELRSALAEAQKLAKTVSPETVLYAIWKDPWMSVSRETYVSAMLAAVGWKTLPLQSEKRYPEVPRDDATWRNAQRVFLSSEPYLFGDEHVAMLRNEWKLTQPVALIDGEMVSWYGVRAIAGLRYLISLRRHTNSETQSARLTTFQ
jgi:ABC-type Fe3+-hydroxamate transport system substrate-binding protein